MVQCWKVGDKTTAQNAMNSGCSFRIITKKEPYGNSLVEIEQAGGRRRTRRSKRNTRKSRKSRRRH